MGGIWVDYERTAAGGLNLNSPKNQVTSIPNLYAIGECDYQYHGANRLGANSLLSCIFSGLIMGPTLESLLKSSPHGAASDRPTSLFDGARQLAQKEHDALLNRSGGGENPYHIHQELGDLMTKAATVVRHNSELKAAYAQLCELENRADRCSLSDTGAWTNQNVVFTKALVDMFPLAKTILKGALERDECRGAHFKPEFALPGIEATDPAAKRREAEEWCTRFDENTRKWLQSTIAVLGTDGEPRLSYEEVDTSLIPPRPRLYGLVGAEVIEEVWKERQLKRQVDKSSADSDGNGSRGLSGRPASSAR
jgi:succinate dehydrogenase / fumarate reductase flavoprotein subunit